MKETWLVLCKNDLCVGRSLLSVDMSLLSVDTSLLSVDTSILSVDRPPSLFGTNDLCRTYEFAMPHMNATQMNASCHTTRL